MNNKNNRLSIHLASAIVGFLFGVSVITVLSGNKDPDGRISLFFVVAAAIAGFCYLAIILIKEFLLPYLNRRRAAIKALGKDGIRILRHDKTARLANKGLYNLIKGDYPDAEDYLQQALANSEVRQNRKFCIEWLVKLYEVTENNARLMWCFRKAAEYSPDDAEAQSRLGHAYFAEGNLDKAEYFFEQALRYDANNGYSYYTLVKIFLVRKDYEKALETLKNLMRINENHPLAHAEYANYYAMRGERENALEECKKAQLCGYKDPDELNRRINAMLNFEETKFGKEDLPSLYYKKAEANSDKQ